MIFSCIVIAVCYSLNQTCLDACFFLHASCILQKHQIGRYIPYFLILFKVEMQANNDTAC